MSTAELLAIILRVGGRSENVLRMAERLLSQFGGLAGLAQASHDELCLVHGIGELVDAGRHVFVHCVQARNRTPTVAAAWLRHREALSAPDAVDRAAAVLNRPEQFLAAAFARIPPA